MKNTWEKEYVKLESSDLELPVTPEKRVRVAAAVATMCRDAAMFGGRGSGPNAETIRGILVMSEEEWERDVIGGDLEKVITAFDPVNPKKRWEQTVNSRRS